MKREVLQALIEVRARRQAVALVTALASGEQRLLARSAIKGDPLEAAFEEAFRFDRSCTVAAPEGELFLDVHNPPLKMIAVGAVHIAQALIPVAQGAGYDVVVVDPRGAFATAARFPGVELRTEWPDEVIPELGLDPRTALVALTHDPKIDDPALTAALRSECFYIGALGSKKTHARRLERLRANGLDEPALARIHGPIGLDIGARGPAEIAIAVMAEVTRTLRLGEAGR